MARVARIDGQDFKRREPWGVFALSAITFGIYFLVWYYKVNDEARRYLRDDSIRPGLSVVAIFIPIVAWVSIWRTGERIVRIQGRAGTVERLSPGVALLLSFLTVLAAVGAFLPFQAVYMQTHLNAAWDAANASTPTEAAALSRG